MTTVCFRDGYLAADTLISYNSITNGNRCKIAQCGDFYVALAGPAFLRKALERWVAEGADPDDVPETLEKHNGKFEAVVVNKVGNVFEYDNGQLLPICADYTAIGSGAMLAIGAMAHGASAEQAITAAAAHDKNTGGNVDFVHFSALSGDLASSLNVRLN